MSFGEIVHTTELLDNVRIKLKELLFTIQAISQFGGIPSSDFEHKLQGLARTYGILRILHEHGYDTVYVSKVNVHVNNLRKVHYRNGKPIINEYHINEGIAGDIILLKPDAAENDYLEFISVDFPHAKCKLYVKAQKIPLVTINPNLEEVELRDGIAWVSSDVLQRLRECKKGICGGRGYG